MQVEIVDVFAEAPLEGNQLAVVSDAGALSTGQMQDIAREMNFSETTFVCDVREREATVRIFTPEWELPFAGHPTLGTAWVLSGGEGTYTLDLQAGRVPVSFEGDVGWMEPPEVLLGEPFDQAPALVGVSADDLHPEYPVQLAEVGPKFVLIGVKNLAALKRAKLNDALHLELTEAGVGVQCVFVFTDDAYEATSDFATRMFFRSGNIREDPATGSANSAFAAYLRALKGTGHRLIVDQGVEMKRPSRLYLEVEERLRVGGKVQPVLTGTLNV